MCIEPSIANRMEILWVVGLFDVSVRKSSCAGTQKAGSAHAYRKSSPLVVPTPLRPGCSTPASLRWWSPTTEAPPGHHTQHQQTKKKKKVHSTHRAHAARKWAGPVEGQHTRCFVCCPLQNTPPLTNHRHSPYQWFGNFAVGAVPFPIRHRTQYKKVLGGGGGGGGGGN